MPLAAATNARRDATRFLAPVLTASNTPCYLGDMSDLLTYVRSDRSARRSSRSFTVLITSLAIVWGVGCGNQADKESAVVAQTAAEELLARAIAYHDPNGLWATRILELEWYGTGADGSERVAVDITLHPDGQTFQLSGRYQGSTLEYRADSSKWTATVDGVSDPTPEVRERMRLHREDGWFWRSYYGFLVGMPMKLRDPGTLLDPEPMSVTFQGQDVLALRVTYEEQVGTDTWYFYFDPETARLVGCRFYHGEEANDGEYIVLEGLIESNGLKLPRNRRWYVNDDDRFLGADEIRALELVAVSG